MSRASTCGRVLVVVGLTTLIGGCPADRGGPTGPITQVPNGGPACWSFDEHQAGQVPLGWSIRQTNPTSALATWRVVFDGSAPSGPNVMALANTDNYDGTFNLAIAEGTLFKDIDLTVLVKAVAGVEDQGGGPIWRCSDENNYYISRFNPLEANYRVYVVADGKRRQLDSVKVDTYPDRWYALRSVMVGNRITCYLDGEKMLEATDDTFSGGGMVGLWTKADAVTSFDDLEVRTPNGH